MTAVCERNSKPRTCLLLELTWPVSALIDRTLKLQFHFLPSSDIYCDLINTSGYYILKYVLILVKTPSSLVIHFMNTSFSSTSPLVSPLFIYITHSQDKILTHYCFDHDVVERFYTVSGVFSLRSYKGSLLGMFSPIVVTMCMQGEFG